MSLSNLINVVVRNGEQGYYVAECLEVNIVTQGKTLDLLIENLKEAVELFFEDELIPTNCKRSVLIYETLKQ